MKKLKIEAKIEGKNKKKEKEQRYGKVTKTGDIGRDDERDRKQRRGKRKRVFSRE